MTGSKIYFTKYHQYQRKQQNRIKALLPVTFKSNPTTEPTLLIEINI